MDEVILLLKNYLDGKISTTDFIDQYMNMLREFNDEQRQALNKKPEIREALDILFQQRIKGEISPQAYLQEWKKLISQVDKTRVPILSEVDENSLTSLC